MGLTFISDLGISFTDFDCIKNMADSDFVLTVATKENKLLVFLLVKQINFKLCYIL